jgi:SOS-response transcriptional repressor LexA
LAVDIVGDKHVFGVRVEGGDMPESMLMSGDLLIVEEITACQPGDVVIVRMHDGQVGVRRLIANKESDIWVLATLADKQTSSVEEAAYRGRVLEVVRRFA